MTGPQQEACSGCGQSLLPGQARYGDGQGGLMHEPCQGARYWRLVAEERLTVLDLIAEVWQVNGETVRELLSMRYPENEKHNGWNLAWRVFRDIEHHRDLTATGRPASAVDE